MQARSKGTPMDKVGGWLNERIEWNRLTSAFLDRKIPAGVSWFHTLGSATMVTFMVLVVTGIFLAMNYTPTPDHAWDSVQYITDEATMGWFIRGMHKWAANAMVVLIVLHMLRVFFMGSYKYPRELTWLVGMVLLLLTLGSAFTGYLLPWDQKAYWATTVGTEIAATIPMVGDLLLKVLRAGPDMGAATLTRFFTFHVMLVPALIATFIGVHLFLVVKQGIAAPPEKKGKKK